MAEPPADSSVSPDHFDPDRITTRPEFGAMLTAVRNNAGLTIGDLSEVLASQQESDGAWGGRRRKALLFPKATLSDWFTGKALPSSARKMSFEKLLRECGVEDELLIKRWWAARCRLRVRVEVTPPTSAEPYRGLSSFGAEHAHWFFGRKRLTQQFVDEVGALLAGGGGVVTAVGASGSGKSSLLHAGLIPALKGDVLPDSGSWPIVPLAPAGESPLAELANRLAEAVKISPAGLAARLREDPTRCVADLRQSIATGRTAEANGLIAQSGETGQPLSRRPLVLIVDQFEQLLADPAQAADQQAFVDALCAFAAGPEGAIVVLGLRADFYEQALRYPQLITASNHRLVNIVPMDDDELRDVIVQPARQAKIPIDDELVELLLRDVAPREGPSAHRAGVLPLLSHALYETWAAGPEHLTVANYLRVGGVNGAVTATARKVYESLTPPQQHLARRMFLCLVHLHADAPPTRRRVPLDELVDGATDGIEHVLEHFIAHRLIIIDEPLGDTNADVTVEIIHDALLTAWPTLREWLEADRSGLIIAQQLAAAAASWQRHHHDPDRLYRGDELAIANSWAIHHRDELSKGANDFLDHSLRSARRRTRRLYQTVAALTVLVILTLSLAAVAWQQRITAEHERDQAQSRMLAVRANQLRVKDVSVARQLALAAYRIAPTVEARSSLLDATAVRPAVRMRAGGKITMYAAAYHPSGTVVAAAADNAIHLWKLTDPRHPAALPPLPTPQGGKVYALAFSPDGNLLAAASADATIRLWNTHTPTAPVPLAPLTGLGDKVYSVVFSPDGTMLASAGKDGNVHLWKIDGTGHATPVGAPLHVPGTAKSVAFSAGTRYLAIGTGSGAVGMWDLTDPTRPAPAATLSGPTKEIGQLAFSPDGHLLAAGSADYNAYVWDVTDPHAPKPDGPPVTGANSWINAVTFSPDNRSLALASSDSDHGVRVLDLATKRLVATLPHPAPATAVKFSPDGTHVVTAANDGTARIWPVPGPALAMPGTVSGTAFSPDGRNLAIGSGDTQLWNVTDPIRPRPAGPAITNPDNFSSSVAFTPDGHTLAASRGRSGTVQLINATDPSHPVGFGPPLQAHNLQIENLAISPNGKILATASRDQTIGLWTIADPANPVHVATLTGFTGDVFWTAFSPDGRLIAGASADKTVRLWNIADPAHPASVGQPLQPANHYVYSVAFSPDGRTLATGTADGKIRLFDITTPTKPRLLGSPMAGPTNYVYALAYNSAGTQLAAAITDDTVWLWDVRRPEKPTVTATLTYPTGALYIVTYRPHDDLLVAGGADNTVWLWHTDPGRAAAEVCATSGDPITREEWARYVPARTYQPPCR